MIDPKLNRNLEETRELALRWSQFHDFFNLAIKGESISPNAELKFLELKTRVAMLHDGFLKSIKHDMKVAQNVLAILGACITLRRVHELSSTETQKLEYDWNETFMLMNETVASLEEDIEQLGDISETAHKMQALRSNVRRRVRGFTGNLWFRAAVALGIVLFFLIGLPVMGIVNYNFIKRRAPFLTGTYNSVASVARNVFPETPYSDRKEAAPLDIRYGSESPSDRDLLKQLTPERFYGQLHFLGYAAEDLKEAKKLARRFRPPDGLTSHIFRDHTGTGKVYVYDILFWKGEDARKFAKLRLEGIKKIDDEKIRQRALERVSLWRSANRVVIIEGDDPGYRTDLATKRYGFKPTQVQK